MFKKITEKLKFKIRKTLFNILLNYFNVVAVNKSFKTQNIRLLLHLDSYIDWMCLVNDKLYELDYLSALKEKILRNKGSEDLLFFDIGSNIGIYSIYLSKNLDIKSYAFEPIPYLSERIFINSRLNSLNNIEIINKAVGDISRESINMYYANVESTHFHKKNEGMFSAVINSNKNRTEDNFELTVPQISIDDFVKGANLNGNEFLILKIDVEEYEFIVLAGMRNLLEYHRGTIYIQLELLLNEERVKDIYIDCINFLYKLGFKASILKNGEWENCNYQLTESVVSQNVLFIKDAIMLT
jgi:FkbM family methyltransferase